MNLNSTNSEHAERKIGQCVNDVLNGNNIRRATAYMSDKLTIKATAQRRPDKRSKQVTILVTVGKPNFVERRFIGVCKKAGMCFPLNSIYHKHWTKKK